MLTQSRISLTFVDVLANSAEIVNMLEAIPANATIRADRVLALTVRPAYITVKTAFVNVNALIVRTNHVSRWTLADIAADSVLTDLFRRTLVTTGGALVNVHAMCAVNGVQGVPTAAYHSGCAPIGSKSVDTLLVG